MIPSSSSTPPKPSGVSSFLSTFVHSIQSRQWMTLQRKAQKLDPTTQGQLHEFLHDHLGNQEHGDDDDPDGVSIIIPDDYELLQKEIDKAYERQEGLEEKKQFVKARLEKYQAKLRELEAAAAASSSAQSLGNEEEQKKHEAQQAKISKLKTSLEPVEATVASMETEMNKLQQKISTMQQRQMELKFKTQECKVVLQELEYSATLEQDAKISQ
jgi:DNA repair exonuclease SbcCD ATPase subunit